MKKILVSLPWLMLFIGAWLVATAPSWILPAVALHDPDAVVPAELVVSEVTHGTDGRCSPCTVKGAIALPDGESIERELWMDERRATTVAAGDRLAVIVNLWPGTNTAEGTLRRALWAEESEHLPRVLVEALRGPALAAALWLVVVIATALLDFVRRGADESAHELLEIELQPARVGGCGAAGIAVGVATLISTVSGWGGVIWAAIALLGLGLVAWHHQLVRIDRRAGTLVWVTAIGPLRWIRAPKALGTPTEVIVRTLVVGDPTSTQNTEHALALATRDGEHDFGTFASGGVVNATADRLAAFLGVGRRGH